MTVITMSHNERARQQVLISVADGRLSVANATGLAAVQIDTSRPSSTTESRGSLK